MPRNPNKTRCEVPRCRAWAMRGHTRCRAHRDDELGPRDTGAPPGNLNALKHGHHSHPLPPSDLASLAHHIVQQPDDLPSQISFTAQRLQDRVDDPLKTLILLRRTLSLLTPIVAACMYASELQSFLQDVPPQLRDKVQAAIQKAVPRDNLEAKVLLIKTLKKQLMEQNN